MRHFWVHSQDQSLQACYLTHGWVEIPSWSWIYVLVTEPKPKVSVTEPSEAESCFQVYYWDHNWQFSCLFKISLFVHGLNISLPIWSPQLPQRHLCPWMDAKLLLLRGGIREDILFGHLAFITLHNVGFLIQFFSKAC